MREEQDQHFIYFKDSLGKVRKIPKVDPKQGQLRLRALQKAYRWWYHSSLDFKFAVIPGIICVVTGALIFNYSMFQSQRQTEVEVLSKLPEHYDKAKVKIYVKELTRKVEEERYLH